MPSATTSASRTRSAAGPTAWFGGLLVAGIVLMVLAGGLVTAPLVRAGLLWPVYGALVVTGVAVAATTRAWRHPSVLAFVGTWLVLAATMPYALRVAPDAVAAHKEVVSLAFCACLSVAPLLLALRSGPGGWRVGWLLGLLLTCAIGTGEIVTDEHLWVTPTKPWPFPAHSAAATFVNPNNFGIVLLAMLVGVLAWRAAAPDRRVRLALLLPLAWGVLLVLASQSRAAMLGLVLVALLEARRATRTRPGLVRDVLTRHRRAAFAAAGVALAVLVAAFTVPALAARNPVLTMVSAALQPVTLKSDLFRVQLALDALRYWRESGYLGTGAGSFEPIMWNDPHSNITIEANLHNAFLELLTQYGPLPFAALVLVLATLARAAWRSRAAAAASPGGNVVRTEMLGHVVAFAALGLTASSALTLPVWWLMLAAACSNAVTLARPDAATGAPAQAGASLATQR